MSNSNDLRDRGRPGITIVTWLAVVVAVTIQILTTIHIGTTPVRIAVSDLVLPVGALIAAVIFVKARLRRPDWVVSHLDLMLIAFFALLGISCLIGWHRSGAFITWAWGPKFVGFGVLIAYLILGALIAEAGAKARERALLAFLATTWTIAFLALVRFFIEINGATPFGAMAFRPIGFSDNPNAFAILLGTALILQLLAMPVATGALRIMAALGLAAMIAALFLTGSRSAYLGLILATPAIVFFYRRLDLRTVLLGAALTPLLVLVVTQNLDLFREAGAPVVLNPLDYATRNAAVLDGGVLERLRTTEMALQLWREAPLLGIGIGGFMHQYAQATGGGLFALHTSALWLLVEMGIVGLGFFAAMFVALFWGIQRRARREGDGISAALCAILLFAAGASVGTEIIYQRHLWFLIGLAAACPGAWSATVGSFRTGETHLTG